MSIIAAYFAPPAPKFTGVVRANYVDGKPPVSRDNGGGGTPDVQKFNKQANTLRVLEAVKNGLDKAKVIAAVTGLSICTAREALHRLEADGKVMSINPTGKPTGQVFWKMPNHG